MIKRLLVGFAISVIAIIIGLLVPLLIIPAWAQTPTATSTPTPTVTTTGVPGLPTATPQPTATESAMMTTFRSAATSVAVEAYDWRSDPVTSTITLAMPTIDLGVVSSYALAVYDLLEQWRIFTTLLVFVLAGGFLRWLYAYATKRRAPDTENEFILSKFLNADTSDLQSEWKQARRRFK